MVRPCVARGFCRVGGERSCINVSGLRLERVLLRAIMDISARAISLTDRPQRAMWVTSVRMRREDRSSISSHPLADLGRNGVATSLRSPHGAGCFVRCVVPADAFDSSGFGLTLSLFAQPPHRFSSPRSSGPEPERSKRYAPACWRAQSRARCGTAVFWPPRSRV